MDLEVELVEGVHHPQRMQDVRLVGIVHLACVGVDGDGPLEESVPVDIRVLPNVDRQRLATVVQARVHFLHARWFSCSACPNVASSGSDAATLPPVFASCQLFPGVDAC
jgi:hypothetical protein